MNGGKFITIEGGEGTGKTTQAELLLDAFERAHIPAVRLRSPGGTAVAEKLRTILKTPEPDEDLLPETELLLFGACHAQMTAKKVLPLLEKGVCVICDRYSDSTTVYQGYARGLSVDQVEAINRFAARGKKPDLTILLDIDPELGLRRAGARAELETDRFDSESMTFHNAVRNGFLALAEKEPERFRIVSAAPAADVVAADIRRILKNEFKLELL